MIRYAERTNVAYSKFLDSIEYDDFSQTYTSKGLGRSFDELNQQFSRVIQKFQEVRAEKEAQYHTGNRCDTQARAKALPPNPSPPPHPQEG